MAYSRWATTDELKSMLTPISYDSDVKKSGIQMMYDDNNLYVKDNGDHTMIIGSTGSGKTQLTLLPQLRLAIKAQESFILHDVKGEMFDKLAGELKKQNYNTVVINLDDPTVGNCFNPLTFPYELYKNGQKDKAMEALENVSHYFFCSETFDSSIDPFWNNAASSLFLGLSLYLFDNAKEEEININSLLNLTSDFDKLTEIVKTYDKSSPLYIYLSGTMLAPNETRGSIISVFLQNMKSFASKLSLSKLLSATNFDIKSIQKDKTSLFIISNGNPISRRLVPLIIEECYYATSFTNNNTRRLNILIDEFENLIPIKDFNSILSLSRSRNVRFCIYLRSLIELRNAYGANGAEMLKIGFGSIIYLLANDSETLETISNMCGNKETNKGLEPLISVEELKLLSNFEAIILMPRVNPIKTKLLPDYEIDWKFSDEKVSLNKLEINDVKTFSLK